MKESKKLKQLFLEGGIGQLRIGQPLVISEREWISSVAKHSNGTPELYKCSLDDFGYTLFTTFSIQIKLNYAAVVSSYL